MRDTQKAFHWIIDLLEEKGIKYKISGGFAARVYGVNRELADIDMVMKADDIERIIEDVRPHIIFGPEQYKDDNWDLELMTLKYEGQEIDVAELEAKIFNQETKEWEECKDSLDDVEMKEVFGKNIPIESMNTLIEYKSKLGRDVDLEDIKQLKIIINQK